ncbi:hypothetical protein GWI33_007329 [Rhynchophorus ferrugineus]|uniref:Luciferin 4-monooxygenase n=1 Tax=Rhynchophorus ferrugineus TaxID=354439 RepID=A0A834ITE1_RHYFE|nr:hypothetical protein GWI33_007329 [Rhynchophorus ferrugineus]
MSALSRLQNVRKLARCGRIHFSTIKQRVVTSGLPDINIPDIAIHDLVLNKFTGWDNERFAIECGVTGRRYTYGQVLDKSVKFSKSLIKRLKLNQGDAVALIVPNIPEYPIAILGILKAGLTLTCINPLYTPNEISKQLLDTSAKAIVTLNELYPLAKSALEEAQVDLPILTIKTQQDQSTPDGAITFNEFTDKDVDCTEVRDVRGKNLAVLPYSSGTTGLPKGVRLIHSNIVANILQLSHPDIILTRPATMNHQTIIPAILPFFHIYGFTVLCLLQLMLGAKIICLPKFTPQLYVQLLEQHKPHVLYLAPPMAIFLGNNPSIGKGHFERVEHIICGAAPLGATDEEKIFNKAQKSIAVFQGYGLTETSPAAIAARNRTSPIKPAPGSIGLPVPNTQVKIVDIDGGSGELLGPNQRGELYIKGPQVMEGYHNHPEETKNAFDDGWLKTGDVGYYNEEGQFYIVDRMKELIKVKGFQVSPAELEEIIRNHPDVSEAAVIGVPHERDGEAPKAFVIPKKGAKLDGKKLEEYVNGKVAPYKRLTGGVVVTDFIPKNQTGKILRRELKSL